MAGAGEERRVGDCDLDEAHSEKLMVDEEGVLLLLKIHVVVARDLARGHPSKDFTALCWSVAGQDFFAFGEI